MDKEFNNLLVATKGIESSFMKMKFLTIGCLVAMVLCCLGCVYFAISRVSEMENQIYILDKGQAMTASRQNAMVTRADEIKAQSERLHSLLFGIVPNYEIIRKQLQQSLEISDRSVYDYYTSLQEKEYYKKLMQASASQWIEIDSVSTTASRYPYPVKTYATLWTLRESNLTKSRLVSTCTMIDVPRSKVNMNGLLVEKFDVLENTPLETRRR